MNGNVATRDVQLYGLKKHNLAGDLFDVKKEIISKFTTRHVNLYVIVRTCIPFRQVVEECEKSEASQA
jgi:hypothetical protein